MYGKIRDELTKDLEELHTEGTYKDERVIVTPQGATIRVSDGAEVLNFCANNYLGLANDPSIREAAVKAMEEFGVPYLAAVGGAGALIARSIRKYTVLAYEDLGPEAVAAMEVEDFPAIVVIDSMGGNYYEAGQAPYRRI